MHTGCKILAKIASANSLQPMYATLRAVTNFHPPPFSSGWYFTMRKIRRINKPSANALDANDNSTEYRVLVRVLYLMRLK